MNDPPPRYATLGDPTAQSYGPSWTTVLECLEKREAMPWQRRVLTVAGELRPDGLPRFRTVVVTIPRQGGKNAILRSLASERALRPSAPRRSPADHDACRPGAPRRQDPSSSATWS